MNIQNRITDLMKSREAKRQARHAQHIERIKSSLPAHPWVAEPSEQYEQRMHVLDACGDEIDLYVKHPVTGKLHKPCLINITDRGHFFNCETDSDLQKASQSDESIPHAAVLYQSYPWHGGVLGHPYFLQVQDFVSPDGLPCPSEKAKWLPEATIDPLPDYRLYVASCVEQAMLSDTCSYWIGACPNISKNLYYLALALKSEARLFHHRLTHGLSPECSHLRVIDKSLWLSRFVKWLLNVPSNPYPWIDEICKSQHSVESGHSVSAGADHVSG